MAETVGGIWITNYEMTRSLGIEPGSAGGSGVLPDGETETGIAVGDYVVFSFAGSFFYGLISAASVSNERTSGKVWKFNILDNRIRLRWMLVSGLWNVAEEGIHPHRMALPRPAGIDFEDPDLTVDIEVGLGVNFDTTIDDPPGSTAPSAVDDGSISRGRVFGHIFPSQWAMQFRTYTDQAISASDIIRSGLRGAVGGFGFTLNFHASQSLPVFDVDANSCMSAAAFVSQVASAQGLEIALDGARTLRFVRRGEGTLVIPPPPAHLQDDGLEMSAEPTKVRVVGDRTLIQVNDIALEPDWARAWESVISEPAWLDDVKTYWSMPVATLADRAELAARSREITLKEFIDKVNEGGPLEEGAPLPGEGFVDTGTWDQIGRMNMPVWKYLNEIVFRSYRIPQETEYGGYPMRSYEIHDKLLCAVTFSGDPEDPAAEERIIYREAPVEFYPEASAYVIAKGQPLDLLNIQDREDAAALRNKDLRNTWNEVPDFTLDAANHSIRFATALFKDGDPEAGESILIFPNKGQGGYTDVSAGLDPESDWNAIVLTNPDYVIEPAEVKVSLVLMAGKFFRDYGTGQRWTSHVASNICLHLLNRNDGDGFTHGHTIAYGEETGISLANTNGAGFGPPLGTPEEPTGSLLQILYEDGRSAEDLASEQADGIIGRSGVERRGRYVLHGLAGTNVNGVIDRVTTTLDFQGGVKEVVDFSKPRPSSGFVSSRDFARRLRNEELFSGQRELKREVDQLRAISRLSMGGDPRRENRAAATVITDLFRRPIGGEGARVKTYEDVNDQFPEGRGGGGKWRAGDLMWLDDSGNPSREGTNFAGVVVANSSSKSVVVATGGTVPTAIKPGTDPEKGVRADPGDWSASNEGGYPIGQLAHATPAPGSGDAVVGLVRIGHGGGGQEVPYDLTLITTPGEPPTYEVTVGWGYLYEVVPGVGDAMIHHEAANMYEEVHPPTDPVTFTDTLRKFPITVGQAVYIKANVTAQSNIGKPPEEPPEEEGGEPTQEEAVLIHIGADSEASLHYIPRVDDLDPEGEPGYLYYKLAVLVPDPEDPAAPPKLEKWLTGSHLSYTPALPAILSTLDPAEGIGVILKEWDDSAKAYKLRVISQKDPVAAVPPEGEDPGSPAQEVQLHIRQEGDRIIAEGNSKIHSIKYRIGHSESLNPIAEFDDGFETRGSEVGENTIIPIPLIKSRDVDPQVTVASVPGAGTVYEVSGNAKKRTIKYQIEGSEAVEVAVFDDGLETKGDAIGDEIIIPIPAGGAGLPPGTYTGDLLVWVADASEWAVLPAPVAPAAGEKIFMIHPGGGEYPGFVTLKELAINLCVEGVPVPYIIYGLPNPPPSP